MIAEGKASEHEKRAVQVRSHFGDGVSPKLGTGVAIRRGLVLTARHVLYKKDGRRATSVELKWWKSDSDWEPAEIVEGCACPDSDLALLRCDSPPPDIADLPLVGVSREPGNGTDLWGDGFPFLTDGTTQGKYTLECSYKGTDQGFMVLRFSPDETFSKKFLRNKTATEIDRAMAGASGTGLFDDQGRLAGIFLANQHRNTPDKKAAFIATALEKFGTVMCPVPECEKITEQIKVVSKNIPDLAGTDIAEMDVLAALEKIKEVISASTETSCKKLACLIVARACDREEIDAIKTQLDEPASVIDVHTTKFGGVERRIASAEDRPAKWREVKRDPIAEYRLEEPPDPGIDGAPEYMDFIGRVGVDLNFKLEEPYSSKPENNEQMDGLIKAVISELTADLGAGKPRYYYAARYNDNQVDTRVTQVKDKFEGLIPFFRLQDPSNPKHDEDVMRAMYYILVWKPSE